MSISTLHKASDEAYALVKQATAIDEDPARYDEAEALYRRAIELDQTSVAAHVNLGGVYYRRGDTASALSCYDDALAVSPKHPDANYNIGIILLELGDPRSAIHAFQHALDAKPDMADAHYNIAVCYDRLGQVAKARPHWRRFVALEPAGKWADIARERLKYPWGRR